MINRKNTSDVVATWRNFLSGKTQKTSSRRLNEALDDEMKRNECFEAIIADLTDCGWEQARIDVLIEALQNATDDQVCMIAYGEDEDPSADVKNYGKNKDNNSF